MRGRMFSLLAVVATLAAAGTVQAQGSYPEKFIRLVVGFSAGGPTGLSPSAWARSWGSG